MWRWALATVAVLVTGVAGTVRLPVAVAAGLVGVAGGGAVASRPDESTIRRIAVNRSVSNRADASTIRKLLGLLGPILLLFSPALAVGTAMLTVHTTMPDALALRPAMTAFFLTAGGSLAMAHAADWLHVTRLESDTEHVVRLPGRFTETYHHYGSSIIVLGAGFVLLYAALLWVLDDLYSQLFWGFMLLYNGYSFVRNPEQRVVSEGIVDGVSVTPWDRFEGFEVTDEKLYLHIDGLVRTRHEFPLDEIADVRAVTYALSQYLGPAETAGV